MIAFILANTPQAHDRVAGLTLAERVALTASHWGATHVEVLDSVEDLNMAYARIQGRALVLWAHVVYEKELLKAHDWSTPTRIWARPQRVLPAVYASVQALDVDGLWGMTHVDDFESFRTWEKDIEPQGLSKDGWICVVDTSSLRRAEAMLWASCRKPIDGIVSSSINRHLSLFISKRIVNTGITPNHISAFCIVVGIVAGGVVLEGSDLAILIGAVLLKINSVVDGVDGELARVKWAYSKFGEFLDASGDNVANFSFFGALTWAMWSRDETTFALFGVACLTMWLWHLSFVYAQLYKMKRGDVLLVRQNYDTLQSNMLAKVIDVLRYKVLRRDFFVMLTLVMCVLGLYGPLLVVMCFGASIAFFGTVFHGIIGVIRALKRQTASA
jgi:phosphatidylglycerophosphate synthase